MLAPLVAACGAAVPQLSGRGLGHTGGTLDKLEAIPGWRAALSPAEMLAALRGSAASICPPAPGCAADRKLYALRDVTGDRRVDPADRELDHVEEDRRRARRRWCWTSRWASAPS